MYLRVFEISASKYMKCSFSYYTRISMASSYKKEQKTLDLLTDIDVIIMLEKDIRGGICHVIHRYAKANNKYMKNYGENKESSYLMHWDVNSLHGRAMS